MMRKILLTFIFTLFFFETVFAEDKFRRLPKIQFIAALGDPEATSGDKAETWGIWRQDPGPRGVWLRNWDTLRAAGGFGPGNWQHQDDDWWLDENGLIMEQPEFSVPPGKYVVTGDREVVTKLTIHEPDANGNSKWELEEGKLFDVTHLPCRSARYTPADGAGSCTPAKAPISRFRITPGAEMPDIEGCHRQDYAVLFVLGVAVD